MKKIIITSIIVSSVLYIILIKNDIALFINHNKSINNIKLLQNFIEKYIKFEDKKISELNKNIINYNKGIEYLKKGIKNQNKNIEESFNDYNKSEENLKMVNDNRILHYSREALGDLNYLVGSGKLSIGDINSTIKKRENSIKEYEELINSNKGNQIIINKNEYVKKKLEELKKKQEKQNTQQNGGENKDNESSSGSKNNNGGTNQNQSNKEKPKNIEGNKWSNTGQFNKLEKNTNKSEEGEKTSKEELMELESYSKMLQDFQKNNQEFLPKGDNKNNNTFDIFNQNFGNENFFNDNIGNDEEKKIGRNQKIS